MAYKNQLTKINSIRNRIHPNGFIVGGLHAKGLKYVEASRTAGWGHYQDLVANGAIKLERKGRKIRYTIKRLPRIRFGEHSELALLRAQHFIRDNENKWLMERDFEVNFRAIYNNLVDAFKY